MGGGVPDGWFDYSDVGNSIVGTRFIAFKVPLKEALCQACKVPEEKWFTPKMLVSKLEEKGLELGLVIDLTNTKRYYNPMDILSAGIGYKKIFTEGRVVPSIAVQNNFFDAIERFLESNENNNRLIGVHCTHGLNRTGYLVCRYMIDRMKFQAQDAINAFNVARGYDIERTEYINDLLGIDCPPTWPNIDPPCNPAPVKENRAERQDVWWRGRDVPQRGSPRRSYPQPDAYSGSRTGAYEDDNSYSNRNGRSGPRPDWRSGLRPDFSADANYSSFEDARRSSRPGPYVDGNSYSQRDYYSGWSSGPRGPRTGYYEDGNSYPHQDSHPRPRPGLERPEYSSGLHKFFRGGR